MSRESSPEYVIARLHPHGRALVLPSLAAIAIAVGVGFGLGFVAEEWMRWTLFVVAAVLLVTLWLWPVVVWRSARTTITTRRIVIQRGFFRRVRSEITYPRVHGVTVHSTMVQAMFRSGDVHLGTGAERDLVMRDVPRASLVQAAVIELVDAEAANASQRRENAR